MARRSRAGVAATEQLNLRLTPAEKASMAALAKARGVTPADLVRTWLALAAGGVLVPASAPGHSADPTLEGEVIWMMELFDQIPPDKVRTLRGGASLLTAVTDLRARLLAEASAPAPSSGPVDFANVDAVITMLRPHGYTLDVLDGTTGRLVMTRSTPAPSSGALVSPAAAAARATLARLPKVPAHFRREAPPYNGTPPTPAEVLAVVAAKPVTYDRLTKRWPKVRGCHVSEQLHQLLAADLARSRRSDRCYFATPAGVAAVNR